MRLLLLPSLLMACCMAFGAARGTPAPDLSLLTYRQQTGAPLPLQAMLRDADGSEVRIGDLAQGMPLILVLAYFHCPNLCGIVREDLFQALRATGLQAGRDYGLAVISIDPAETSSDARTAMAQDAATYGDHLGVNGSWHYLTGSADELQTVGDSIGFRDRPNLETKQFVHPAGIVFVTSNGIISSYLLGVGYKPLDVRSAILRASAGKIAPAGSPVLLLCFHFNPTTGRYTLEIMKLLRLAAFLTVATIAATLCFLLRRPRIRT